MAITPEGIIGLLCNWDICRAIFDVVVCERNGLTIESAVRRVRIQPEDIFCKRVFVSHQFNDELMPRYFSISLNQLYGAMYVTENIALAG